MKHATRWVPFVGICIVGTLGPWVAPALASHESFGVYEDWRTSRTLRSDRWSVVEAGTAQEVRVEIHGHHLLMRQRREGRANSDFGVVAAAQTLVAQNPAAIDQMEVDLRVQDMALSGCAVNPGQTLTRVLLDLSAFNDGPPDGQTGDHFIRVAVISEADSFDPAGVLNVQALILRCLDPACSVGGVVVFNPAVATVPVEKPFTLRAISDRPNSRFLVGVNDNPDVVLAYDPALDQGNARVAFATLRPVVVTANCTAEPTMADLEIAVRKVRTNLSAIIP